MRWSDNACLKKTNGPFGKIPTKKEPIRTLGFNARLRIYARVRQFISVLSAYKISLSVYLRTFARNFSNIDFFLKILPLKDDELAMSEI